MAVISDLGQQVFKGAGPVFSAASFAQCLFLSPVLPPWVQYRVMADRPSDDLPSTWPCLRGAAGGVVLDVSVVPGAKRTEAVGLHDGALRVRLAAPPVDGKANDALLAWLARELQCARRDVHLLRGASARRKQIVIAVTREAAAQWLARQLAAG